MATHCSTLAWKIPSVEVPGRLQSMGSLRVGHDWVTSLSLFTFIHWRRKCKPTPVFLPGESQGRGRLVGCRLWGRIESDTTEAMQQQQQAFYKLLYPLINTNRFGLSKKPQLLLKFSGCNKSLAHVPHQTASRQMPRVI